MAKPEASELTTATETFDAALAQYTRLGDLFLRAPLETLKHLERANATLSELADAETKLQQAGQLLITAIASARDKQQAMAQQIVARAPELQHRNGQLAELMKALGAITTDVARINAEVATGQQTSDIATQMHAAGVRAHELAQTARDHQFPDLADQAHALHQRLEALAKKLETAGTQ
ncbi:MAG: hypothetical protein QM831_37075 [Kofleriaceae bacterium]